VNKSALRDQILVQLHAGLTTQTAAAHLARDEAISEESKPENKYDTHGQEAAYLAEGQARLAQEIQAGIGFYQAFVPAAFAPGAPIAIGALVELGHGDGRRTWYFIGPRGGGLEVPLGGHSILVLTPQSPLGRQLLGKRAGESVHLPGRGSTTAHQIVTVR
jgi:transcription elongation GreA/GreB family factor